MAEGVKEGKRATRAWKKFRRAVSPAWLLAASVAALVLVGGIAAPLAFSRAEVGQDAEARELLLDAVPRMRSCAFFEGDGSYASCDAAAMAQTEPDMRWGDGLAPVGWGKGGVGRVFVSDLGEKSFRVETTSASGKVFKYDYENGIVTRATIGAGGW